MSIFCSRGIPPSAPPPGEIGSSLPNDQRQPRTLLIQKDVLPYQLCPRSPRCGTSLFSRPSLLSGSPCFQTLLCRVSIALARLIRMDAMARHSPSTLASCAVRSPHAIDFRALCAAIRSRYGLYFDAKNIRTPPCGMNLVNTLAVNPGVVHSTASPEPKPPYSYPSILGDV